MEKIDFLSEYTSPVNPSAFGGVMSFYNHLKKKYEKVKLSTVKKFLESQDVYTLHRPRLKKFTRGKVFACFIDDNWQMDLCDMRSISKENDGVQHILTIIDVFSKFAWIKLLKNKEGTTVLNALKSILENRKPRRIQADEGFE